MCKIIQKSLQDEYYLLLRTRKLVCHPKLLYLFLCEILQWTVSNIGCKWFKSRWCHFQAPLCKSPAQTLETSTAVCTWAQSQAKIHPFPDNTTISCRARPQCGLFGNQSDPEWVWCCQSPPRTQTLWRNRILLPLFHNVNDKGFLVGLWRWGNFSQRLIDVLSHQYYRGGVFEFSLFSSLSFGLKYPVSLILLSYQRQFGIKQLFVFCYFLFSLTFLCLNSL